MGGQQIGAKRAGLKGSEPRRGALKGDVGDGFALEHLADENKFVAFFAEADAVGDHALAEHGGEFGSEVAHLIGVREQNQIGLGGLDDLRQSEAVAVGRVGFEQIVLDEQNFGDIFGGQVFGEIGDAFAEDQRR